MGAATDVVTELYLDPLALDCTAPNSGTDFTADLTGGPGNLRPAGAVTGCGVIGISAVDADTYLFQVAPSGARSRSPAAASTPRRSTGTWRWA